MAGGGRRGTTIGQWENTSPPVPTSTLAPAPSGEALHSGDTGVGVRKGPSGKCGGGAFCCREGRFHLIFLPLKTIGFLADASVAKLR